MADLRKTLAQALAASAEDALHGAVQLSLSAQRAPTCEACEDGWGRVALIVEGAERFARAAATVAAEAEEFGARTARAAQAAARRAEVAARAARRLLAERNHAYTFHSSPRFSFGEGWYLAAAGVLAGVSIQIEPGAAAPEVFLRAAGLGHLLQPYRPRPRTMKHVTEIVGRAFRADPAAAQRALRAAFLGAQPASAEVAEVRDWIDRRLQGAPQGKKVLLWIRTGVHHPGRNTRRAELLALTTRAARAGLSPVWIGDAVPGGELPDGVIDLTLFWKDAVFQGDGMRRAQLQAFEHLRAAHQVVGQLGVTTAGMDGPALMGLPTLYLTDAPNVRMRAWVDAVPGYRELVRGADYLDEIDRVLLRWAEAFTDPTRASGDAGARRVG
jgi:hypothetical protein